MRLEQTLPPPEASVHGSIIGDDATGEGVAQTDLVASALDHLEGIHQKIGQRQVSLSAASILPSTLPHELA